MYYLWEGDYFNGWQRDKFCITDTVDFVEEWYSKEEVEHILSLGINVFDADRIYITTEDAKAKLAKMVLLSKRYPDFEFSLYNQSPCISLQVHHVDLSRKEIVVPKGVDVLESMADSRITKLVLQDGFRAVGVSAIKPYNRLEEVVFPSTPYRIEKLAFKNSGNITDLDLSNAYYIGQGAFESCERLRQVKLNSELDFIHDNSFYGCTALHTCEIPEAVKYIGDFAFLYTHLPSAFIPSGCETMHLSAFNTSTRLWVCKDTTVYFDSVANAEEYTVVYYNKEFEDLAKEEYRRYNSNVLYP